MSGDSGPNKRFRKASYASGCPVYCCYCMVQLLEKDATVEHVVPRAALGTNRRSNMLIACQPCNHAEGRWHAKVHPLLRTKKYIRRMARRREPGKVTLVHNEQLAWNSVCVG